MINSVFKDLSELYLTISQTSYFIFKIWHIENMFTGIKLCQDFWTEYNDGSCLINLQATGVANELSNYSSLVGRVYPPSKRAVAAGS